MKSLSQLIGFILAITATIAASPADETTSKLEKIETLRGKIYYNCTIKRLDPDGIYILHSTGIGKVFFNELPREWQIKFGYDPDLAGKFQAEQNTIHAEIARQAKARDQLIRERITGQFTFTEPIAIRPELTKTLEAESFSRADGIQTTTREISEIIRTRNALGGEGLPIRNTRTITEEKRLKPVIVVGSKSALEKLHINQLNNLTLFPVPFSDQIFERAETIYALSQEEAISKHNQIAKLIALRSTPFTSLKFLGAPIEEIETKIDPLTMEKFAIENGTLKDIESSQSPELLGTSFTSKIPVPAHIILFTKNAICKTVSINTLENNSPIPHSALIEFFKTIDSNPFEEIIIRDITESTEPEAESDNPTSEEKENWIDEFGTIKAFWSKDGGTIALAKASQFATNAYSAVWLTTYHSDTLKKIKENLPPNEWWDQIRKVLDGEPPRIYQPNHKQPSTIDSFLNGPKTTPDENDEGR